MSIFGKLIFISLLIMCAIRCKTKLDSNNFEPDIEYFWSQIHTEVHDSIAEHFNLVENVLQVINPSALYAKGYCGLFYKYELNKKVFLKTMEDLEKNHEFRARLNQEKGFTPRFMLKPPEDKYPIPDFNASINPISEMVTADSSIIYGLKYSKGKFFNKKGIENILQMTNTISESEVGKGYSKGALVDPTKNTIIYWTIVW